MVSHGKIMFAGLEICLFLVQFLLILDNLYLFSDCFYVSDVKISTALTKLTLRFATPHNDPQQPSLQKIETKDRKPAV
jgi:hypothetical protein